MSVGTVPYPPNFRIVLGMAWFGVGIWCLTASEITYMLICCCISTVWFASIKD